MPCVVGGLLRQPSAIDARPRRWVGVRGAPQVKGKGRGGVVSSVCYIHNLIVCGTAGCSVSDT